MCCPNKQHRPLTYRCPEDVYGKEGQRQDKEPQGLHAIGEVEVHCALNTQPS